MIHSVSKIFRAFFPFIGVFFFLLGLFPTPFQSLRATVKVFSLLVLPLPSSFALKKLCFCLYLDKRLDPETEDHRQVVWAC